MQTSTTAKKRVLDGAEELFGARGYSAVSMRDIADSLGMRQASLYYHVPQGKEQLYLEVTMRSLRRHADGIRRVLLETQGKSLEKCLSAVAFWFISHAPLRLLGMLETDLPALSKERAQTLSTRTGEALFAPLTVLFIEAQQRGQIRDINPAHLAGYFLALVDGISYSSTVGLSDKAASALVSDALDIFLNGILQPDSIDRGEHITGGGPNRRKENLDDGTV